MQCAGANIDVPETSNSRAVVLDEVLWTRIQSLPAEARRLLEVVAVSGQPLRLAEARQAADLSLDEHGAMAVLRSGRLIRSSGTTDAEEIEIYHDRIRETILSHLPAGEIRELHHRIAVVLESVVTAQVESGADPIISPSSAPATAVASRISGHLGNQAPKRFFYLAYHFDAAGEATRAFRYALAMADQARSQYALEIAEQLYRIAERGAEHADDATRYRVAESLGDVLMLRGCYPDAAIRFKAALKLTTNTLAQAQAEGKLAELSFKCGDMKTAIDATERALRMLGNRIPSWNLIFFLSLARETLVQTLHTVFPRLFLARENLAGAERQLLTIRLHNRLTYCYWFGKDTISCLWTHLRGMNLAERHPATLELAQAYSIHAPVMTLIPYLQRGLVYAQRSFDIYTSLDDLWGQGQSSSFYGMVYFVGSQYQRGIEKFSEAVRLLERTGDYWEVNIARCHICNSLYRMGNLSDAVAEARRIYESGLELGDMQALGICLDVWSRASGGQVAAEILETERQRPRADVQVKAQVMLAYGVWLFSRDRLEEAAEVFNQGSQLAARAGVKNAWTVTLRPWLASALRRQAEKTQHSPSGNRSALLKHAKKTARRAMRSARTFQNDLPHALRECGLIAALLGQARQARQYLDESLNVAERQGARFEHAQSLLARGQVGQKLGWPDAQQDLTAARQALQSLGADFALDNAIDS